MLQPSLIRPVTTSRDEGPLLIGDGPLMAQLRADIETAARSDARSSSSEKRESAKRSWRGSCTMPGCVGNSDSSPSIVPACRIRCSSPSCSGTYGSFTGAYRDKLGLAALADRGTLFLDELGEMSARMQGILLRFAETLEIHRLGADRIDGRVDVQHRRHEPQPARAHGVGRFPRGPVLRLNVIHLIVPPLRERATDILLLFNHYLAHYCDTHGFEIPTVLPATEEIVLGYAWPGNVRELKNVVDRLVVRHHGGALGPDVLPAEMRRPVAAPQVVAGVPGAPGVNPPVVRQYPAADAAWAEMVVNGKSFWTVVHPLFIDRELTKTDVREIIRRGLEQTQGSYRKLVDLFHMMPGDYKRFLAFLYQHDCHLPFHPFREPRSEPDTAAAAR